VDWFVGLLQKEFKRGTRFLGVDLACGIADRGYKGGYEKRDMIEPTRRVNGGTRSLQDFTSVGIAF
jgi:hypothetical protein